MKDFENEKKNSKLQLLTLKKSTIKKILFVVPFILLSCASPYLKNYEPILTFLETQKLDKHKIYVLQKDKIINTEPLRLFNGNDGLDHYSPKNLTHDTFHSKHWKKMGEFNNLTQQMINFIFVEL